MPAWILYSPTQKLFINGMPSLHGTEWDKPLPMPPWKWGDRSSFDNIKAYIKETLSSIQGNICAYCGMRLYVTSAPQIEHIAPKGEGRYPQFMLQSNNLTLACSLCNGFEKKEKRENFNTISKLDDIYENCLFNIVHPYLDDPHQHYDVKIEERNVIISHLSLKGQKSIAVFKLAEEPLTSERGKSLLANLYDFDLIFKQNFDDAMAKRP